MFTKNKTKKVPWHWSLARYALATLLFFFMPILINQLEWTGKPWASAFADEDDGNNRESGGSSRVAYLPPPNAQADVNPQSMIVMSNDHQLFYKAYTDFSDLDGDGKIDDTYKDSIRYYGYFDSEGCYEYNSSLAGGAFTRTKDTSDDFVCNSSENEGGDGGNYWSGNFLNWATMTRMDILRKVLYGGKRYRDNATESTILERAFLPLDAHSFAKVLDDDDTIEDNTPFDQGEITICNTTYSSSGGPPLIRVARGRWPRWSANERWQCVWRNEKTGVEKKYRDDRPREVDEGIGEKNYHARVEVCVKDSDEVTCDNGKPVGLLHKYADSIDFGLVSGSYAKNKSGGVLRSNVRSFKKEFNSATGVFDANAPDDSNMLPDYNGIVSNIDAFRISGYSYSNGQYAGDSCGFGTKAEDFDNGQCSSWGNPFAEMTLEAIRYLTGEESPSDAFDVGNGIVETGYLSGLTSPTWTGNETSDNWCAAHSMVLINASEASFDANELSGLPFNVKSQTDDVGDAENLSGDYFVGEAGANKNKQCTAKSIGGLGGVLGICPTAPGLEGSYNVAGLAKHAYENLVIKDPNNNEQGSNISTYAVRLSSNIPEIKVEMEDKGKDRVVTIVPACESYSIGDRVNGSGRNIDPDRVGKCAIVDFRVSESDDNDEGREARGSFDVIWEDSEFGGDYDSDLVMTLEYRVQGKELKITTDVDNQSTSQIMGVGYIISGTKNDGFHAHSGINGYDRFECGLKDKGRGGPGPGGHGPDKGGPGPKGDEACYSNDSEITLEYELSDGSSGNFLRPPLYYAAKYGNDGVNEDGSPSAYFPVARVGELVDSLEEVLDQVLRSANRTGAGLGYSTNVDNFIFQTLYNNRNSWSGDLIALSTSVSGVAANDTWSAREEVPQPDSRTIITSLNGQGEAFRAAVAIDYGYPQSVGSLIRYLRGDTSGEQRNGGDYRDRLWLDGSAAALGDIIDSKPFVVGKPDSYYVPGSAENDSYIDFISDYQDRTPMVYVGANDGMLHGFDAETGVEKLAYVPGLLLDSIGELADPGYEHRFYVDGSPVVLDAIFEGEWHSVLASGLGAGGRGVFALNVTDPSEFSELKADETALFEYGPSRENDLYDDDEKSHIGHIYGPPSIAQMENGKYAVVFGNGYFSDSGKAALYIIYLDGAADGSISKDDIIRLVPGGSANSGGNGLSTASLVDRDSNGRMDTAYAGDLQGNLWRFDLSDKEDSDWQDSIDRLFTSRQANGDESASPVITTGVAVGRDPNRGIMLFFGTGSAPKRGIPTSENRGATDGFYAIGDVISRNLDSDGLPLTRNDLRETTLQQGSDSQGISYSSDSENIDDEEGWYIYFPIDGERVVDTPLLQGELITFSTLIPGLGFCGAEDEGYLYKLNAFNGMAFDVPVLDINGDGVVNSEDMIDVGDSQVVPVAIKTEGSVFTPTPNGDTVNTQAKLSNAPPLLVPTGLVSWRELVN
nr:PilC/PilY family type IV pilus protein [uncultured Halomonas sp.]